MSPITRKPKTTAAADKAKSAKFVRVNGSAPPKLDRLPVMINFDRTFLDRIDRMAQDMGLNRTAFITTAVGEKLVNLEKAQA